MDLVDPHIGEKEVLALRLTCRRFRDLLKDHMKIIEHKWSARHVPDKFLSLRQIKPVSCDNYRMFIHTSHLEMIVEAWRGLMTFPDTGAQPTMDTIDGKVYLPHPVTTAPFVINNMGWLNYKECNIIQCKNHDTNCGRHGYRVVDHRAPGIYCFITESGMISTLIYMLSAWYPRRHAENIRVEIYYPQFSDTLDERGQFQMPRRYRFLTE